MTATSSNPARECQPEIEPVAWRWKAKGNKHWIYDPAPAWMEDHRNDPDIEFQPLYLSHPQGADTRPISDAPRDGSEQAFDISFKARAFWCDDLKRWVLVRPLHMECLPGHAKYLGPARSSTAAGEPHP